MLIPETLTAAAADRAASAAWLAYTDALERGAPDEELDQLRHVLGVHEAARIEARDARIIELEGRVRELELEVTRDASKPTIVWVPKRQERTTVVDHVVIGDQRMVALANGMCLWQPLSEPALQPGIVVEVEVCP